MEDGRLRLSSTTALARIVSIAGHPFLLIPLTIAAVTQSWRAAGIIAAGTILPLLVVVIRNVRRQRWSDVDVSRHDQRAGLYFVIAPLLALSALALYLLGAGAPMIRGLAAAAAMFLAGFLANRFLKVSLHMMCAAFCAVLLGYAWFWLFVAAIAWSRWKLERHTIPEIVVGLAIGVIAGLLA